MYIQHFGLAQYPFSLTPNTRFFLKLPSHQEAFNLLIKSLNEDGELAKITGEVGTGKTMLCRKLLNALEAHANKYVTAFIPHPILTEEALMHALAEELRIEHADDLSYRELLKRVSSEIIRLASHGCKVILFVDEAQAMPEESLKAIHLLTQIQTDEQRRFQVVLFGQPELDTLLKRPGLTQLNEHIAFSYQLPALDRPGTEAYIQHRLAKAGYSGPHMFTETALDAIHKASGGIPRLINILAHKALMVAFGKGEVRITEDYVNAAIDDTESTQESSKSWAQRLFNRF